MEEHIFACIDRLVDLAILSVEWDCWPEMQALVAEADEVSAHEAVDLLRRLRTEVAKSVEMGDWRELRDACEDTDDLLASLS